MYDMANPVLADFIKKECKFFQKLTVAFYAPLKGGKGRELMKKVSFHKTRGMSKKGKLCQSITMSLLNFYIIENPENCNIKAKFKLIL